jgi:hypothetical protein
MFTPSLGMHLLLDFWMKGILALPPGSFTVLLVTRTEGCRVSDDYTAMGSLWWSYSFLVSFVY